MWLHLNSEHLSAVILLSDRVTFWGSGGCCCRSVTQLCPTLCDPMDCSTPGLPVHHHLLKFVQVHVHCTSDAVQPSHRLDTLFSFCPQSFPASGTFPMSPLFTSNDQNPGASASTSVLPVNIQGWSPLRLTGVISLLSKGLSGVFSSTTVWMQQFFGALPSLALTTVHDLWEDHSLDYTDLCWQSNVSAFEHTV